MSAFVVRDACRNAAANETVYRVGLVGGREVDVRISDRELLELAPMPEDGRALTLRTSVGAGDVRRLIQDKLKWEAGDVQGK